MTRGAVFGAAVAVALLSAVLGLSGAGWWTVPVMIAAAVVGMWSAPHDEPTTRPGFPADRYRHHIEGEE